MERTFRRLERSFDRASRHRRWCILLTGLLPVLLRLCLLPWFPAPLPAVPDEFAHVLVGQTFAEGRVTNPTHPLWQHFESLFILQQPHYTGKYQPGYGATLAVGDLVAHHPWAGILITEALALSCTSWLLYLWLPRRWALFGSTLAMTQIGVASFWTNSYLGVPTTAIGGALVLAAMRLLSHRVPRARYVALGAAGVAILLFTRPYDAMLLLAAFLVVLWPRKELWFKSVLLLMTVLVPSAGLLLWYNDRVTGSPWKLPYQVAREQYGVPQSFFWQPPILHSGFRHAELRKVYEAQLTMHEARNSAANLALLYASRVVILWRDYFSLGWLPLLLLLPAVLKVRSTRPVYLAFGLVLFGQCLYFYYAASYLGPVYGAVLILLVQSLRLLRAWKWGSAPLGACAALASLVVIWTGAVLLLVTIPLQPMLPQSVATLLPTLDQSWYHNPTRAAIYQRLSELREPQLVIVRYGPAHQTMNEYVYNEPRIDQAHVAWARDMGAERNAELLRYYPHRTAWLLEPDAVPFRLTPYR